jgi:hypothetical protein
MDTIRESESDQGNKVNGSRLVTLTESEPNRNALGILSRLIKVDTGNQGGNLIKVIGKKHIGNHTRRARNLSEVELGKRIRVYLEKHYSGKHKVFERELIGNLGW